MVALMVALMPPSGQNLGEVGLVDPTCEVYLVLLQRALPKTLCFIGQNRYQCKTRPGGAGKLAPVSSEPAVSSVWCCTSVKLARAGREIECYGVA